MPLSEYEQRVLAQMEQHLRDADPQLAQTMQSNRGRIDVKRLSIGILVALVGIGLLVAGVAASQVWLGVLGFVGMLAGAMIATTTPRSAATPSAASASPQATSPFMERQQERWDRRRETQ